MISAYTLPSAPQPISRLLDAGTRLYTHTLRQVLPFSFAANFVLQVPGLLMLPFSHSDKPPLIATLASSLLLCVAGLLYIVLYLAAIARMWSIAKGGELSARDAARDGYKAGVPFVIGGILYILGLIAGLVLLIIPGIYLGLSLSLFMYLAITEKLSAVAALKRSHTLIRGHWWRSATIVTVPLVLLISLLLILQLVPMFIFGFDFKADELDTKPLLALVLGLVGALISSVMQPWFNGIVLMLYHDLRLRLEGSDLEHRIAGLASEH